MDTNTSGKEYENANDKTTDMTTLSACMDKVQADGYTGVYKVAGGQLTDEAGSKSYAPAEIKVINFYRFEGESDPGDEAILYVIETADGGKGTLTDAYGIYASAHVNAFMQQVENIHKETDRHV